MCVLELARDSYLEIQKHIGSEKFLELLMTDAYASASGGSGLWSQYVRGWGRVSMSLIQPLSKPNQTNEQVLEICVLGEG